MKKVAFITLMGLFGLQGLGQNPEIKSIQQTIKAFAKAADQNKAEALPDYLDPNYRVVMNRLFGSKEVSIIDRTTYIQKIKSKEWGGDSRLVTIEEVIVNGTTATAHVKLKGAKMTMISLMTLVKDENGNWKLVSDTPIIVLKI